LGAKWNNLRQSANLVARPGEADAKHGTCDPKRTRLAIIMFMVDCTACMTATQVVANVVQKKEERRFEF
jgi:hypothetical protein